MDESGANFLVWFCRIYFICDGIYVCVMNCSVFRASSKIYTSTADVKSGADVKKKKKWTSSKRGLSNNIRVLLSISLSHVGFAPTTAI